MISRLYNIITKSIDYIQLKVFITDDGCTDGTADAIKESYPDKNINLLQDDGNLYLAASIHYVREEALKHHNCMGFQSITN